jgi:Flp pilus assembly protein TadD
MPAMLLRSALVGAFVLALPFAGQSQIASIPPRPASLERAETSPIVSADMLRHPISSTTRRMLHRAIDWMRSGDHQKAIQQLQATLAKDPSSAAYVHSLLGYEFMRTDQVSAAIHCFEQAVLLLPHDPANHHNFAVSLVVAGNYERAEEEARRAYDLAPDNPEIRHLLDVLEASAKSQAATLNAQRGPNESRSSGR